MGLLYLFLINNIMYFSISSYRISNFECNVSMPSVSSAIRFAVNFQDVIFMVED